MIIGIINGPNLNLLGTRQPEVYGNITLAELEQNLVNKFPEINFQFFQSNIEGEIINAIQEFGKTADAILLNAGGYTHTSVAIGDAVASIETPVYEIHISNIFSREDFRHHSFISKNAKAVICGAGIFGYELGVLAAINK